MSVPKVIPIEELTDPYAFELRQFWMGDKSGKWIVVSEDGMALGRYIRKTDAQSHVDALLSPNDSEFANLTTDELITKANELIAKIEEENG